MLKTLLSALAILAVAATVATAATVAVATGNVNLRAGPSTAYPVVTVVPAGSRIVTHGCVAGYSWCDIAYAPIAAGSPRPMSRSSTRGLRSF